MTPKLYYIHDPMCSWCWGYRPTWKDLQLNLPEVITIEYVLGGLAPDSDIPMPESQQQMIKSHWKSIQNKLGTKFNFDFWIKNIPRRSTYNACRAVIAAKNQGYELEMIDAIQKGYYLRALNPSDIDVLTQLGYEIAKNIKQPNSAFNPELYTEDLMTEETDLRLTKQIQLARELTNQGFPSLVIESKGIQHNIPINYKYYQPTIESIADFI